MHEWIAVPIIALNIPLVLVPTILIVKMRMRSRELEHRERMRALELGRDWPAKRNSQLTAPWLAFLMGVVMPIVVFLFVMRGAHGPHHDVIMKTGSAHRPRRHARRRVAGGPTFLPRIATRREDVRQIHL